MADARWTDETETLVARAEYDADKGEYQHQPPWDRAVAEVRSEYRKSARATLAALAGAGLLVEPGYSAHEEWAVRRDRDGVIVREFGASRRNAEAFASTYGGTLLVRTVHDGPWREQP